MDCGQQIFSKWDINILYAKEKLFLPVIFWSCMTGLELRNPLNSLLFIISLFVTIYSISIVLCKTMWKLFYEHYGYRVGTKSVFYREIRKGSIQKEHGLHLWRWKDIQNVERHTGKWQKRVRERAIKQCGMLGKSSWAWLSMGPEEGRVRDGVVGEAGVNSWEGIDMVQLSATSTLYLFLLFYFITMRLMKTSQSHLLIRAINFPTVIWEKKAIIYNENKSW